jgi:hypothetical protein
MSHAFHCPQVQCAFIPKTALLKHGSSEVFPLGPQIKIVLAIAHKELHYAVFKVDILERKVTIWDAAWNTSSIIVNEWRDHVISALRMHLPDMVAMDGMNVVEEKIDLPKDGMPLWIVEGFEGQYAQTDNYSCGPIAINRFAESLKSLSDGKVLGDGIDELAKFMDSADANVANAKRLFQRLLEKRHNVFKRVEDQMDTATNKVPDKEMKEAAKAIASLGAMPMIHATDQLNMKKQRTSTVLAKRKGMVSDSPGEKGKEKKILKQTKTGIKCHAGHSCRLEDFDVFSKAVIPMHLYASSVQIHFITFVCLSSRVSRIALSVTKNMWCLSVNQRPSLMTCYKVKGE